MQRSFESLLKESVAKHGHLCPGQILGVRMAMLGCRLLGIKDPHSPDQRKKLIVFVEIDRCATDAIESVTGCKMGKRTLKFRDYGLMAATFWNLGTDLAYRIVAKEEAKRRASEYSTGEIDPFHQQLKAYRQMPESEIFSVQRVQMELPLWEMPGPPRRHARCHQCKEVVRDGREVQRGQEVLCRPCAGEAYFRTWIPEETSSANTYKEAVS
jgi:formylmethanofuran dehydrogenase subunit E